MLYANIIVDISHEKLDKCFQYIIPAGMENEIHAGVPVNVPFGKGNRVISGYVIEVTNEPEFDVDRMKEIIEVIPKGVAIESRLIDLAWFIKENYGSTMNQALKTVIPVKTQTKNKEKRIIKLNTDKETCNELASSFERKHAVARLRLLTELMEHKELSYELVTKKLNISSAVIKDMEKLGIIVIDTIRVYRTPVSEELRQGYDITLNEVQKKVTQDIISSEHTVHLIHGITGSGKTEVYMELIADTISKGKEAIVLIPEIALTYQTVMRFYGRFGNDVAIVNSKLSQGERYDQFEMAKEGKVKIMIGPRSAIFTPFRNLGLIVIDEEHEGTYKSENVPKYHAREVAIYRAEKEGAKVILGSATPSVDAYYKAKNGQYMLHEMFARAKENSLADVSVVDMREEMKQGNKNMFSNELNRLILDRLSKREQIILFINRRGYAGFVSCRSCGEVIKCPHCDVSLTLHNNNTLVCHYCNHTISAPKSCPKCSSKYIAKFGTGTQKVEEAVKQMYPQARVLRMDMDTTSKKGGHEKILSAFANGEADIIIGTQMIVKGHDFPNATLVGVIAADLSLYANDFRASERTFELLTQAAGRAGRGNKPGNVVIQTYSPENPAIISASRQDYEEFYKREILYRQLMEYPPVYYMTAIFCTSKSEENLEYFMQEIKEKVEAYIMDEITGEIKDEYRDIRLIGPAKAGISRINDMYRMVYYIKSGHNEKLIRIKNYIQRKFTDKIENEPEYKDISMQFDFNPMGNY